MAHWSDDLVNSPGFCTRPFFHAYIAQNGNARVCCLNDHSYGNVNDPSFDEVMSKNNPKLVEFRKQFINSKELPDSCGECKKPVQNVYSSKHIKQTRKFLWQFDSAEDLINNEKIYTYDIRFNNLCNIKCHYCNFNASSRFASKLYKEGRVDRVFQEITSDNVAQILKRFEENIDHIFEFYFAGGEPLIMKEHYQILDLCLKYKRTDILLSYNSNMTKLGIKNYNLFDYWKHFDNIQLNASIDAGWEQFNFIRDGANWDEVVENLKVIRQLPNVGMTITPTIAFWNMEGIPKVYRYLVENNLLTRQDTPFGGEILDFEMLRPAVLPKYYKDYLVDLYNTEYKDYPELQVLLPHLNEDLTRLLPKTKQFVEKIAAEKNCNFFDIFPELKGIFDGIQ